MTRRWIANSVRKLTGAVMLFVAVSQMAHAQERDATQPLTLEQAVHMALQQNPAFQTSADEAEATRARLKQVAGRMVSTIRLSPGLHARK